MRTGVWVAAAALGLAAADAHADGEPARASAEAELRLHRGDTEQDEVAHYGYYPSMVIGGGVALGHDLEVAASIAAAKVSAVWENIGGLASGALEGRWRPRLVAWGDVTFGAGVAFPLTGSIPTPDCYMPDQGPGDSLVFAYGENTACWDRSAYRRAALHRGGWNMWMWAPDWVTAFGTARIEHDGRGGLHAAVDAGAGVAFAVTDAHDDDGSALVVQVAPELGWRPARQWLLGARALAAGAVHEPTSPFLISAEPFIELSLDTGMWLRAALLLPLADLRNDEVPPGLGGYKVSDNKSLGLSAGAAF